MARKDNDYLNKIKKEYNVDTIYSWSRYNTYKNSMYEYFLKYVLKVKPDQTPSIYLMQGGRCHEIIENFYLQKIDFCDMIDEYNKAVKEFKNMGLKYNRVDEESNAIIGESYEQSMREFYRNHNVIKGEIRIEPFIMIKVKDKIFQGYIDCLHKDKDGNFEIIDWKTSTIYKGKKIEKEIGQLKLYALGLYQKGVPIEKIRIGWNFLKYINVTYQLENGKSKTVSFLRKDNWIHNGCISKIILENSNNLSRNKLTDFDSLPSDIKRMFKVEDCYVMVSPTLEELEKFEEEVYETVCNMEKKERQYRKVGDEKIFWDEQILSKDSYYFYNLCGYSRKLHKPFNEYLEELEELIDFI